jgi:predicted transcriptional regulator of viral defense system
LTVPQSHLDALLELAAENEGLVTTRSAAEAGISRRTLAGMVERGRLERLSRGVYRLVHSNRDALSPYREAILWVQSHRGPRVALSHETALAVLGLTDANPSTIQLTVPPHARLRRSAPARIAIHRAILDSSDVIEHEGLPVTSVPRTVLDLARSGNLRFAADAVVQARREGFITEIESRQLTKELKNLHGA